MYVCIDTRSLTQDKLNQVFLVIGGLVWIGKAALDYFPLYRHNVWNASAMTVLLEIYITVSQQCSETYKTRFLVQFSLTHSACILHLWRVIWYFQHTKKAHHFTNWGYSSTRPNEDKIYGGKNGGLPNFTNIGFHRLSSSPSDDKNKVCHSLLQQFKIKQYAIGVVYPVRYTVYSILLMSLKLHWRYCPKETTFRQVSSCELSSMIGCKDFIQVCI